MMIFFAELLAKRCEDEYYSKWMLALMQDEC